MDSPAPAPGERRGDAVGSVSRPSGSGRLAANGAGVQANPDPTVNGRPQRPRGADEAPEVTPCPGRQEKPLSDQDARCCPYRTPTLVGRGKYPQVDERSSVKELGKLTP